MESEIGVFIQTGFEVKGLVSFENNRMQNSICHHGCKNYTLDESCCPIAKHLFGMSDGLVATINACDKYEASNG